VAKLRLYRWLAGDMDDNGLLAELRPDHGEIGARAILRNWTATRDGIEEEPEPAAWLADLWEGPGGLFLRGENHHHVWRRDAGDPGGFERDAGQLLLNDDLAGWAGIRVDVGRPGARVDTWPGPGFTLVARWVEGSGSHLTPQSDTFPRGGEPGPVACAYLGLPGPKWMTSAEAAAALGCSERHARRLFDIGLVHGRRRDGRLEFDPLAVASFRRRHPEEG
jgi:hypothetical protein